MMLSLYSISLFASCLLPVAMATCECGYQDNAGVVYQYAIETDFSTLSTKKLQNSADWAITSTFYETQPYAINYTASNVRLASNALQLTCSAADQTELSIASGQIRTKRTDILHGSFRAKFKIEGGSGAIGAFFFYANDNQEIDIEHLTRETANIIHFTNQPSSTSAMTISNLSTSKKNNYRFDWDADHTSFYVNGNLKNQFTTNVPTVNGSIYFNSWANGGSFSGAAVPTSSSVLSVTSAQLYFNTSDTSLSSTWAQTCLKSKKRRCHIGN